MKKKGFTLVELLGVIVILAIITLLAMSGYGKISKNVKEQSYKNLISYIETKAIEYANETGNLLTNVGNLVKLGYIEADDEEGNVKSPIDETILNCHIVSITKDSNSLYGKYSEEEECNLNNLIIKNLNLGINVYATNDNVTKDQKIEGNEWTNKNVILEAYIGEKINKEDINKITWQSNVGHETREINGDFNSKNEFLITAEQIVNTSYFVTIELKDETTYQAQVQVKIDKQRPIIYETFIEKENEYTSQDKKMTVTANDGNGSGIYGYYVGTNPNCNEVEYNPNNNSSYETYKDNGIYYICVKDNAGNVSEDISTRKIEVKNIEKQPPKIEAVKDPLTIGNQEYEFKENVTVSWGASGEGEISCSPTVSKKSGVYDVTCIAIAKTGLTSEITFEVRHNYPAIVSTCQVEKYHCKFKCESWITETCETSEGTKPCTRCAWGGTHCGEEYGSYYIYESCMTCPFGGTLNSSDNICYY